MFIYAAIQMIDAQRGKKQFDNYERLREKLCALCNEFGRSRNMILHIYVKQILYITNFIFIMIYEGNFYGELKKESAGINQS